MKMGHLAAAFALAAWVGCTFAGTRGSDISGGAGAPATGTAGGALAGDGGGGVFGGAGTTGRILGGGGSAGAITTQGAAGSGATAGAGVPMICLNPGDVDCQRACGLEAVPVTKVAADVLIIFDRSVSMIDPATGGSCGNPTPCGSKWMEMTTAVEKVVSQTDTTISWGLKLFADSGACGIAPGATVPVAASNGAMITAALTTSSPGGHTPTRLAVQAGAAYLASLGTPAPKYILLATDGIPNCIPGNHSQTAYDMAGAAQAVADAAAMGIPTFVLGVGTGGSSMDAMVFDPTLTALATAGGKPRAGTPNYYHVSSSADVVAALGAIQGQVNSCVFNLAQVPPDPTNIAVLATGGAKVPKDPTHTEGWDYGPGMMSVQLYGSYCAHVVDGTLTDVKAIFGCPMQIIP
jgi:hypothetical protein